MLDSFFKISERGSTVAQEVRGGLVTFFTMAYIVVLNPLIIGYTPDKYGNFIGGSKEPQIAMIAAATALVAGVLTILMGVVGRYPLALATGLGLNTFVAVVIAKQMSWADAMGLVVLEGIVILILVLTGFRTAVFKAVPAQLKIAISVGIGLFIALIGLVDAGVVRKTPGTGPVPVTLGYDGQLVGWPVIVFALGLFLMIALMVRKTKGALLIGIAVATVAAVIAEKAFKIGPNFIAGGNADGSNFVNPKGWGLSVPAIPSEIVATPDFGLLGHFSIFGAFSEISIVAAILIVFTLLLSDFFDTVGTVTAIGHEAGLINSKGEIPHNNEILIVDSVAAIAGGAASISSNTSYIESAAGVGEGARTGLASVVTGIAFLASTVFAPLVAMIPYEAATPALIVVGFLMMTQIGGIDWSDYGIALPAFLTIIMMPFTYNISVGIGAGFITHVVIRLVQGRRKEVHPLLLLVSGLFIIYFLQSPINIWIG
ncbi:COG2252 Xanthine/uracil/vitamin C permease [Candidatus Nanopelagicaceae bacterium]